MLRKRTVSFSEVLNILQFDDNCSNSTQESSPYEESNASSHDFSANDLSTSKKVAQHMVSRVYMAPEEVFEQDHLIDQKISIQQTRN